MQQVIKALEAERAEVQERLAWLDQTIEEFRAREERPSATAVAPAPAPATAPKRSTRRGTAARASSRRHAARDLKPDPVEQIVAFLTEHPQSTTGAVAKALNAERSTVAAQMAKLEKTGDIVKGVKGYSVTEGDRPDV